MGRLGYTTRSTTIVGLAIAVVNAFVLFDTVNRFVNAKLAAEYDHRWD